MAQGTYFCGPVLFLQVWGVRAAAAGRVRAGARPLQGRCLHALAVWQLQRRRQVQAAAQGEAAGEAPQEQKHDFYFCSNCPLFRATALYTPKQHGFLMWQRCQWLTPVQTSAKQQRGFAAQLLTYASASAVPLCCVALHCAGGAGADACLHLLFGGETACATPPRIIRLCGCVAA